MKTYVKLSLGFGMCAMYLFLLVSLHAQETSRVIPFNNVPTTIAPSSTGQILTIQLWDAATAGSVLYCENQTLDVDASGAISFNFGAGTAPAPACASGPPGLKPQDFPSGTSRFLDVVDATATSVLPISSGRIPLTAAAFALSAPTNNVPANLTMVNSSTTAGNITKDGALFLHNFGTNNFFAGANAGNLSTSGTGRNTGVGVNALMTNTTGADNTASGTSALISNTTGIGNTAIGVEALKSNTTGFYNTASGVSALISNTTGVFNTATGVNALYSNTTGTLNTASGLAALYSNTTGTANTASGVGALSRNTTGSYNTASGRDALSSNTLGNYNTASGHEALNSNDTGSANTASGNRALLSNTNGYYNTASGYQALFNNTGGNSNTASGFWALYNNTTGTGNTAVGYQADVASGGLTNATAIGFGATVNASNKIRLGNSLVTVIEAQVGITAVSDRNQKENFQPVEGEQVLGKIKGLNLTSWNYIGHDPKQFRHYGPVAQEFFGAFGHDAVGTIGTSTTINSGDMEGILMVAVQALEKRTTELWQERERLKAENAHLAAELAQQKESLAETVEALKAQNAHLAARTEELERLIRSYVLAAKAE